MDAAALRTALIAAQAVLVFILWFHDWIPMGSLNDVAAVRRIDGFGKLFITTLIQSVPYSVLLYLSVRYPAPYPHGLMLALWIAYGILFVGALQAWWLPYLFVRQPKKAERFAALFGKTHAFLPAHNGIRPNTLHCLLHLVIVGILVILWRMSR